VTASKALMNIAYAIQVTRFSARLQSHINIIFLFLFGIRALNHIEGGMPINCNEKKQVMQRVAGEALRFFVSSGEY
jgi:hypothetical protein